MFGRKILFLAAWYVAWNVVSSIYNWNKRKVQKDQQKQDVKLMVENFLETQKNFVSDIEKKYLSEENREALGKKKKQFLEHSEKYIKQGEKLLSEINKNEQVQAGKGKISKVFAWLKNKENLDKTKK